MILGLINPLTGTDDIWIVGDPWYRLIIFCLLAALLCTVVLGAIHMAGNQAKRLLVMGCAFAAGLFYVLEFFIPPDAKSQEVSLWGVNLTQMSGIIGNANQVVAGFTFLLGVYNLVHIHGNNIRRLRKGWGYSLSFFIAFLAMTVSAFARDWQSFFDPKYDELKNTAGYQLWMPSWVNDVDPTHALMPHDIFSVLFEGFYRNMDATMFSILAFYIVSAAYRAFRIRSKEAAVLMITAVIMMMGQVPLGQAITAAIPKDGFWHGLRIEEISQFVLNTINGPVQRAIGFGLGLGALGMALRIWLSLERGTYFEETS